MDSSTLLFAVGLFLFLAGTIALLLSRKNNRKTSETTSPVSAVSSQMQLQAYERMALLIDRIALPNLIARMSQSGISAREMQLLLTQTIRQEFDYNITQQIYVSAEAWNAVKNLKEQNMLIINQNASTISADATGLDLNKLLLEYLMTDQKGNLHELASQIISFEAKKLL